MGEEILKSNPHKSFEMLTLHLNTFTIAEKKLKLKLLECTMVAQEVCRKVLNNFCKLRKTPLSSQVYVASPKPFGAPLASLCCAKKVRLQPPLRAVPHTYPLVYFTQLRTPSYKNVTLSEMRHVPY